MRKKYTFRDNIWGADLTNKHLLSKFNKGFRFLLCVIDVYSKDAWVISLKDKKTLQLPILFKKILISLIVSQIKYEQLKAVNFTIDQWNHGSKKMILKFNTCEGKSLAAERSILKNKIDKYMTSFFKKIHINKLDDIVNKYNNTYHSTIKIKSIDVKSSTYIDLDKVVNLNLIMLEYQSMKVFLQKVRSKLVWRSFCD